MLIVAFYALNGRKNGRRGNSLIYVNLRECPTYARKGFDPADLRKIPD